MSAFWKWPNGYDSPPDSNGMRVTDEYGMRTHPIYGNQGMHWGIDLIGLGGFNRACAGGVVIFAAYYGGAGNYIKVKHPGGTVTGYKHNASFLVGVGQTVSAGQALGVTGTTGDSTGIHLHLETQMIETASPMNPREFLDARMAEDVGSAPAGGGSPSPGSPPPSSTNTKDEEMRLFHQKFSDGNEAFVVSTQFVDRLVSSAQASHLQKALGVAPIVVNEQDWDVYTQQLGADRAAFAALLDSTLNDEQAELVALIKAGGAASGPGGTVDPAALAQSLLGLLGPKLGEALAEDLRRRLVSLAP